MSTTDTTPADNQQLAGIFGALAGLRQAAIRGAVDQARAEDAEGFAPPMWWVEQEQGDPQWAGPSLPHPTEATSENEADELQQGWDDWRYGIEPNTTEEAAL